MRTSGPVVNRKARKTISILVKVPFFLWSFLVTPKVLEIFLGPQIILAEESRKLKISSLARINIALKYNIMILESLESQKDFGNPVSAFETLDSLLAQIKEKITPPARYTKKRAIEVLKTIGKALREEGNFEYKKNRLLIEGLRKQENGPRFIDCDDYSSIYLYIGEQLGLSLQPAYIPGHIFLKCTLPDKTSFYWESTLAEEKQADFYKKWLNIKQSSNYPKILGYKEFEAVQLCNLGAAWHQKREYERAIDCYHKAIRLDPQLAAAFNNLGAAYARQGRLQEAMECYQKALQYDPRYATAVSNIGVFYYKMENFEKALEYFEKAVEMDPKFKKANAYKTVVTTKLNKPESGLLQPLRY